jgi:hypothetical protein
MFLFDILMQKRNSKSNYTLAEKVLMNFMRDTFLGTGINVYYK